MNAGTIGELNLATSDHVRLATLELLSPPVPRQNKADERLIKLVREREWKDALEILGKFD